MSGTGTGTLERIKKLNEGQESFLLKAKSTEGNESSIGDNESWDSVYKPTTIPAKYENQPGIKRYVTSLKHLLPVRIKTGPGSNMPVDYTGCCAFTFFSWLTPFIWRTFRRGMVQTDLYTCSSFDGCYLNGSRFSDIWERRSKVPGKQVASLSRTLFLFIRTRYLISCLVYLLCVTFGFIGPTIFMRLLLQYIQGQEVDEIIGITWMLGLILCEFLRILCFSLMWAVNIRTAVRASSAVMALLYKKVMKLRTVSSASSGELVNLFSNDCRKVFMMAYNLPLVIGGPLVVVGAVVYTWMLLGLACFVGVGVFAITYALQFGLSYIIAYYRKKAIKATDERVSLMSEFLSNIKLIKLYAWEKHLIDAVRDARLTEKNYLEKCQYMLTLSTSLASLTAVIATVFTILSYTFLGYDITPAEAFTLVMVNSIASHGIRTLPMCIRDIINGIVALSRLQVILHLEEKDNYTTIPNSQDIAVNISGATLDWEQVIPQTLAYISKSAKGAVNLTVLETDKQNADEITPDTALVSTLQMETGLPPILSDINFLLPKGKLVGVCGTFGSGKSSLIAALLGQMRLLKGQVAVRGSIAYVSQQPWILNATLRENILFGKLFSSKRYYETVYCCGLPADIANLPGGDQTELGEKGVNLSGGQKQRISLARAQYADRDLYLLDDPLSAVDSQTARHIFQHCIKGALKGKSILFITHQLKFLQECDSVIMLRDGTIIEQGTHDELMNKDSEYAAFAETFANDDTLKEVKFKERETSPEHPTDTIRRRRSLSKSPSLSSTSELDETDICDGQLTMEEKIQSGDISWTTYLGYIQAAGGLIICALVIIWFIIQSATDAFSKYWLSYWLSQGDGNQTYETTSALDYIDNEDEPSIIAHPDLEFYQLIYGLSVAAMLLVSIILGYLFTKTALRASSNMHNKMLQKVFHSPMHFFDTTPSGRILNVFTSDTDELDTNLPTLMVSLLQKITTVIFALLLVAVVYHWFVIPLVVLAACFLFLQRIFRATMRDLKRFENTSRSPIFSHVAATVDGLATIKAFEKQEDFYERFTQLVDQRSSPQYLYYCSMRWLGLRMDFLGLIITLTATLFVIFFKEQVNPAFAALALSLVMQLSGMYQFAVRLACDLETRFTSVERIQNYAEELETESPLVIEKTRPSPDWPTRGRITFIDVKMNYRPGLPLALKGLSFDIEPQEKIGIVGKTGSGKSSIGVALFRLVELTSGSIIIDGINIKDLGLEDLRSRMSIIPQDPVLFRGTIRHNLDPLSEFEEVDLWDALEESDMKGKISSLDDGLDAVVVEGGSNFSVGEKQLLCMARALLRQSKVVLLDEATASVDSETDKFIQKAIKQVFANSTVITIAHRLTTIDYCDRVMVLSEGKIIEFDTPQVLLENPKSHFSAMMAASKSSKL